MQTSQKCVETPRRPLSADCRHVPKEHRRIDQATRRLPTDDRRYALTVLVEANFSSVSYRIRIGEQSQLAVRAITEFLFWQIAENTEKRPIWIVLGHFFAHLFFAIVL